MIRSTERSVCRTYLHPGLAWGPWALWAPWGSWSSALPLPVLGQDQADSQQSPPERVARLSALCQTCRGGNLLTARPGSISTGGLMSRACSASWQAGTRSAAQHFRAILFPSCACYNCVQPVNSLLVSLPGAGAGRQTHAGADAVATLLCSSMLARFNKSELHGRLCKHD